MTIADFRAARVSWLVNQDDDWVMSISWDKGGTPLNVGVASDWDVAVWATRAGASAGGTPLVAATVTIPSAGTTTFTIDDNDAQTVGPIRGWWAATFGDRKTMVAGPFVVDEGVAQ